jgi:DNA repair protein RadD
MITLRPYQLEGMAKLWEYFQNGGKGNPLICWPTGVGKTVIPAFFIHEVMKVWPNQRFILMSHVSELIKQDAEALLQLWPQAPLGIFSAGLKQKEAYSPIVYAGIQSAIKDPSRFGFRDIAFVDEAHLISQDESSQYLRFFETLKLINPALKIIGLTATPFRMGQGLITDGGLFTDIVHDLTTLSAFNKMIEDGYIAPLVPKRTKTELDISEVGIAKGEYIAKQLQAAVDKDELNHAIVKEIVEAGQNRQSWLLFASGIEHAEHISSLITNFGINCAAVHSKQKQDYNDDAIAAFKQNELRAICNYGKLTTGFNHPAIDLIGMIRATMSVPLWIQMLGRGTRPCDESRKRDCLVLDFAKNTPRLGPINDPIIPRKKGEKEGEVPVKICEVCGTYNHTRIRFCDGCGHEFEFKIKITAKPGIQELIKSDLPIIEIFDVDKVVYNVHHKLGSPPMMKVSYMCGLRMFKEFICFEHKGYARKIANDWWRKRHNAPTPMTTQDALQFISQLKCPSKIKVWVNKPYPDVRSAEF